MAPKGSPVVRGISPNTRTQQVCNIKSPTKEQSCHIDRRVDYQGSRPPMDLQAGVGRLMTGPSSSVAHQAVEGEKVTVKQPLMNNKRKPTLPSTPGHSTIVKFLELTTATVPSTTTFSQIFTLEPYNSERPKDGLTATPVHYQSRNNNLTLTKPPHQPNRGDQPSRGRASGQRNTRRRRTSSIFPP